MKFLHFSFLAALLATAFLTGSCKKKTGMSDGALDFSSDTIVFDTVFTTIGSTTQNFRVKNPSNSTVKIDNIQLMGGSSSPFRLNFDGVQGTAFSDIEIPGHDSLYCFVEVTLQVNGGTQPMVIEDSIRFTTNGQDQYVVLAVWGQDAYFHYDDTNSGTWPNDKPHVIYGFAGVDDGQTLNIQPDTKVYLHKGSVLYVFRSTLNVNGTAGHEVTFQGDRLESFYDNVAGQYYGIYFDSARPSLIQYAKIKNGTTGIHLESEHPSNGATPTLTIRNSEIWNHASYGMLLYDGAIVKADNVLIHSNAVHSVIVLQGADFTFTNCQLLGYGTGEGTYPAVGITNYLTQDNTQYIGPINYGDFNNCVIAGTSSEQLVVDTASAGIPCNVNFRNSYVMRPSLTSTHYVNCFFSGNLAFESPGDKKFKPLSSSILRNSGGTSFALPPDDITGAVRDNSAPDIGAYEIP